MKFARLGFDFARSFYRFLKSRCSRVNMVSLPEQWRSSRVFRRWLSCCWSTASGPAWGWGFISKALVSVSPDCSTSKCTPRSTKWASVAHAGGSAERPCEHLCYLWPRLLVRCLKLRNSLSWVEAWTATMAFLWLLAPFARNSLEIVSRPSVEDVPPRKPHYLHFPVRVCLNSSVRSIINLLWSDMWIRVRWK